MPTASPSFGLRGFGGVLHLVYLRNCEHRVHYKAPNITTSLAKLLCTCYPGKTAILVIILATLISVKIPSKDRNALGLFDGQTLTETE